MSEQKVRKRTGCIRQNDYSSLPSLREPRKSADGNPCLLRLTMLSGKARSITEICFSAGNLCLNPANLEPNPWEAFRHEELHKVSPLLPPANTARGFRSLCTGQMRPDIVTGSLEF